MTESKWSRLRNAHMHRVGAVHSLGTLWVPLVPEQLTLDSPKHTSCNCMKSHLALPQTPCKAHRRIELSAEQIKK